mgnify:CR=1 FL=1
MQMSNEELEDLLELGPVRLRINGEYAQYTRDMGTADTCNCYTGEKQCGFISELEWRDKLLAWDIKDRIAVWDIGTHKFANILASEVDKIIGHGIDEPEEESSCCSSKEKS